jgi:hypothetical protein
VSLVDTRLKTKPTPLWKYSGNYRRDKMWIMTTYGFFSVTQSQDDHNVLMVRARRREHIEKLQRAFKVLKGLKVVDWPNRDYRFRLFVDRADWKKVMVGLIDDTDFSNFKSEVKHRNGHSEDQYAHALSKVWSTMAKLQPTPPYGYTSNTSNQQLAFKSYKGASLECSDCDALYPDDGKPCYCGSPASKGYSVSITSK